MNKNKTAVPTTEPKSSTHSSPSGGNGGASPNGRLLATPATPPILGDVVAAAAQAVTDIGNAKLAVPGLVALSPGTKRRTVKVRKGAETVIEEMILAALAYPTLIPVDVNPQAMSDALAYLTAVRSVDMAAADLSKTVSDTLYAKRVGVWTDAMVIYAALKQRVGSNPDIAPALAGMTAFLARASKATTPPAGSSTPAGGAGGTGSGAPGTAAGSTTATVPATPAPAPGATSSTVAPVQGGTTK